MKDEPKIPCKTVEELFISLILLAGLSATLGSSGLTLADVYAAVLARAFPGYFQASWLGEMVVWELRLPPIIMGILAGMGLAAAGAAMQGILRNPLASPFTLGISSAASFGAALAIILGAGLAGGEYLIVLNAFVFSLIAAAAVFVLAEIKGISSESMVLAGIAIMYFFSALTSVLQYVGRSEDVHALVFWTMHGFQAEAVYRENLARVRLVSQVRDTHDHEIIDLDHYFEYFGGLSNAVKSAGGDRPQMLITDTTGEAIRTEDLQDSVNRGIRTRLLNPKWIDAMLQHDYHGGQQIAKRVENALGLAATTHSIADWVWSGIAERYIFDEQVRDRLEKNNKFACGKVMERLLEAERRGYWNASENELERIKEAYLDLEGVIEDASK